MSIFLLNWFLYILAMLLLRTISLNLNFRLLVLTRHLVYQHILAIWSIIRIETKSSLPIKVCKITLAFSYVPIGRLHGYTLFVFLTLNVVRRFYRRFLWDQGPKINWFYYNLLIWPENLLKVLEFMIFWILKWKHKHNFSQLQYIYLMRC